MDLLLIKLFIQLSVKLNVSLKIRSERFLIINIKKAI